MKFFNSLLSLILIFVLLLSCGTKQEPGKKALEPTFAETEPNDSQAQAHPVKDGTIATGFIGAKKDQDWYQISIPSDSSAILRAELTGVLGLNLKMELFDSDNERLVEVDRHKEEKGEALTNYGLTTGDYFLRVRELWAPGKERKFNDTTAYLLHIHLSSIRPDVEFESNNKAIKSNLIQSEQPIRGYISPFKDVDWYKILPPGYGNHYLELQLSGLENVDLQLEVYDPIEALLLKRNNAGKGEGETILNLGINPELEFYYIAVRGGIWHSNEDSTYQLSAIFRVYEGKMELEPNDRLVRASEIVRGDTVSAFFDTGDDVDWYQIQSFAPYPQIARIEVFSIPKVDLNLALFNETEQQVWSVNETGEMENEIITNIGLKSNTNYFLKVENLAKSTNLDEKYSIYMDINRLLAEEEFEPNNQKDLATIISLDTRVKGFIHPIGDTDFYKLDLSNSNATGLKLTLKGIVKVNTDMVLYDADLQIIAEANSRQTEETETLSVKIKRGVYFIKVYDNDGKESNYRDQYELLVISQP
ncbi:MAG: hypothetical protein JSW07_13975 [bacterium]|nr:MAG: hypothetical protein JSW07_13975 [bacterium]